MPLNRGILTRTQSSLTGQKSLLRAQAAGVIDKIKQELEFMAQKIIIEAQDYPPERENQKYVRTFDFLGAWDFDPAETNSDGSLSCRISNNVVDPYGREYSVLVMGRPPGDDFDEDEDEDEDSDLGDIGQLPIHQGRWKPLKQIQVEHAKEQANRIRGIIQRGLRG